MQDERKTQGERPVEEHANNLIRNSEGSNPGDNSRTHRGCGWLCSLDECVYVCVSLLCALCELSPQKDKTKHYKVNLDRKRLYSPLEETLKKQNEKIACSSWRLDPKATEE